MIKCITLILLFSFCSQFKVQAKSKTATYIDVSTNLTIKVKFKRDFIKVKYLTGKRWVKYILVGPNEFDDCRGSKIFLRGRDRLVWRSRRYGEQTTFRRYHEPRNNDYYRPRDSKRSRTYSENLEGVWYEPNLRQELILVDSRSGIKLKFRGTREWFVFDKRDEGVYLDRNGNSYTVIASDKLVWRNQRGDRSFVLEKRSDIIDWD